MKDTNQVYLQQLNMTRSARRNDEEEGEDPVEEDPVQEEQEEMKEEQEEEENEEVDEEEKDKENEEEEPNLPEPEPVLPEAKPKVEDKLLVDVALDPEIIRLREIIKNAEPTTELEIAFSELLKKRESHIDRLTGEVLKLKSFISKRKQTYKRKRKDEGAPTRALSAYNIFVQDRFSKLAKQNEQALQSADTDAQLKRVPPASLVASTGNMWKELSAEEKAVYEERAKTDRKRYEEQMSKYQPPDKQANRKRNKTGYNMFFSAHVLRLKQSEQGVPSERGSVARLVGNAWKQLSAEEKQYYEREADKQNGMNPVEKVEEEEEDPEKAQQHMAPPEYGHMPVQHDMHMHGGYAMGGHPPQHDPRQGYNPYPHHMPYGQPPHQGQHYDYYAQHQQQRGGHPQYQGYPPQHGHYEQRPAR